MGMTAHDPNLARNGGREPRGSLRGLGFGGTPAAY